MWANIKCPYCGSTEVVHDWIGDITIDWCIRCFKEIKSKLEEKSHEEFM